MQANRSSSGDQTNQQRTILLPINGQDGFSTHDTLTSVHRGGFVVVRIKGLRRDTVERAQHSRKAAARCKITPSCSGQRASVKTCSKVAIGLRVTSPIQLVWLSPQPCCLNTSLPQK